MEHQNQDESGEKNTAVRLNKEIVLPTTGMASYSGESPAVNGTWAVSDPDRGGGGRWR